MQVCFFKCRISVAGHNPILDIFLIPKSGMALERNLELFHYIQRLRRYPPGSELYIFNQIICRITASHLFAVLVQGMRNLVSPVKKIALCTGSGHQQHSKCHFHQSNQ